MAIRVWNASGLIGGTAGCLDSFTIAGAGEVPPLTNGDRAFVVDSGKFYFYVYDSTATAAENSPLIIRPDSYVSGGNWVLSSSPYGDIQVQPEIVSGLPITGGISGGNVTVSGNTLTISPTTCLDSGLTTKLYTTVNTACVIPSVANTEYFVFLVKIVSTGLFEFRPYSTLAGVLSDAQVSKYRFITWAKTDGSSVVMPYIQNGQELEFTGANKPQITASLTTSYVSYAVSTIASVDAEKITYETYIGIASTVAFSLDGSNLIGNIGHNANRLTTVKTANIYAYYATGNSFIKIAGMRLSR